MHCDNSISHDNQSVICLGSKLLIGQKEIRCDGAIEPERFPEIVVNTKMSCFLHYHSKCFTRNNYGLFMVLKIYFKQFYPLKLYKMQNRPHCQILVPFLPMLVFLKIAF